MGRIRQALERAPIGNAGAIAAAAAAAVGAGIEQEALPLLWKGIANHPHDAQLWHLLGVAHRNLNDLGPALEALNRAATLAPDHPPLAHARARSALEAGRPAAALFERAHALAPLQAPVLLGRAAAYFAEGRADIAIAQLEELLLQNPGWDEGHMTLARLRWMSAAAGSFTEGFEQALGTHPHLGIVWRELVGTLLAAEHYDAALDAIARARAAVGASLTLDRLEAEALSESGDLARAEACFAALLPRADMAILVRYVRHLLRSGRPAEAAARAEAGVNAPGGEGLWPYLGAAWRLIGDARWQWLEGDERLIGVHDIADTVGPLDALADRLRGLHIAAHQPLEQSLRGGTQTDGPLFSRLDPEIMRLRDAALAAVADHVAQLPPVDPRHPFLNQAVRAPLRFSGSWSVRLVNGGRHVAHIHSHGWISSAFYIALPAPSADPHGGWLALGELPELGLDLAPLRLVEPRPGRLVLFPSLMWHGTRPFDNGERLTVAFDIARPRG
jgi:tetratricopeptide (TPR) repeat protein